MGYNSYYSGMLQVDHIHSIFYECFGNRKGKPVFVFHGGPGYGCDESMLVPFDLSQWNVVLFDQRGAGRSIPKGCIINNTTQDLVEDIKKLANHLEIGKFVIKGESWGSTLALAFSQTYPDNVLSMILSGVFLGNSEGTLIGYNGGFERFYPDLWDEYIQLLPDEKRKNPYAAYYDYIFNGTMSERLVFSRKLIYLENLIEYPIIDKARAERICDGLDTLSIARIETHYTMNDFFLSPTQIIDNCYLINHIPTSIVQGRHDLIVPIISAWQLYKHLPDCAFYISESGAHSESEMDTAKIVKEVADKHLLI